MSALDVALAFVDRINAHDVDGLGDLMAEVHRFVDSLGAEVVGREPLRQAWRRYFELFPDYRISVERHFVDGRRVALFGTSNATHAGSGRIVELRAAWLAVVSEGRVAEWRVYADNEPARAAVRG